MPIGRVNGHDRQLQWPAMGKRRNIISDMTFKVRQVCSSDEFNDFLLFMVVETRLDRFFRQISVLKFTKHTLLYNLTDDACSPKPPTSRGIVIISYFYRVIHVSSTNYHFRHLEQTFNSTFNTFLPGIALFFHIFRSIYLVCKARHVEIQ